MSPSLPPSQHQDDVDQLAVTGFFLIKNILRQCFGAVARYGRAPLEPLPL
jgi:hypothetical protein